MWASIIKAAITAAFIVGLSELAKRSNYLAALMIALPLATAMTVVWLYIDTHDSARATNYAWSVMLLTPPGFIFLALLPLCVRWGIDFWMSMAIAIIATGASYFVYTLALQRLFGISI